MKLKHLLLSVFFIQTTVCSFAQSLTYDIRLNQLGFLPNSQKLAAVVNTKADSFKVMTSDLSKTVYEGLFLPAANYASSGEDVRIADFTLMTESGNFVLVVNDLGKSVSFPVNENVFTNISKATIKQYYFNRVSTPILSQFAGVYARAAGHPDTAVIVLPSAASANRPAGTKISTPGGWYDAGDYNKYIVSSGISVFTLLSAYETYPNFYDTLNTNIPESNNNIPDILDEAMWNIKWMMSMQDTDGGVYNKTTEANFSGFVMPSTVTSTRYVCAKSTAATLDFAAIMAMTARIYKKYLPVLADTALKQALKAWEWAKKNPNIQFANPSGSGGYPGVNTGEYGDTDFADEFSWCAAELYITTKDSNYYKQINPDNSYNVPGWPTVKTLGLLSLLVNKDSLTPIANLPLLESKLIDLAAGPKNNVTRSPYRIPGDFYYWAGNNAFANWGMVFMQAFRITKNASYYNAAVSTLDYLLGKNATAYCFVTGFGSKSPLHPHHRISSADGVADPVPGMLVCGVNGGYVTDCGASSYPSTFPAKYYLDNECSYSSNEVAIGINAPLAFLAAGVQTEYLKNFIDSMPRYFNISTNKISLPYRKKNSIQVIIEGNSVWSLTTAENWIDISDNNGSGNARIEINTKSDNPGTVERTGKIYINVNNKLTDSLTVTQNGVYKSFRIESEDYINMSGLQTETTSDAGSGLNLGYVDINDWATYSLDVTVAGVYDVKFRHAGYAGNFDILINDTLLQTVTFPATTDWQVWTSHSAMLSLPVGQHIMKIIFKGAGTNLNWMQFDWKYGLNVNNLIISNLKIYPIPADNYLNVQVLSKNENGEILIINPDGKTMIHQSVKNQNIEKIDISDLKPGIYILKASFGSQSYVKKLVIE